MANIVIRASAPRDSLPLPPCSGLRPGKRNPAPGLALCGGGSLDRERQGANRRNLALIFPSMIPKALDSNCQ